jgi:hypothetical protein
MLIASESFGALEVKSRSSFATALPFVPREAVLA